jgi:ribosomal protein S18 acetylase RimI-like enzyme
MPQPDLTPFRPATAADLPTLLELMRAFYAEEGYPFSEAGASGAVVHLLENDRAGRLWIAQGDQGPLGYVVLTFGYSLEHHGVVAFVDEVFVVAEWRGRGLGTRALALAEAACRTLGVRTLQLEVERENVAAQELYRRSGFKDHGRFLLTKRITQKEIA